MDVLNLELNRKSLYKMKTILSRVDQSILFKDILLYIIYILVKSLIFLLVITKVC